MTERGRHEPTASPSRPSTLVLGCGALAKELLELVDRNGLAVDVDVRCLPAALHNRPERIGGQLDRKLAELAPHYERVFVAYADCGSGGEVARVAERHGVEILPGAHCYAFYAGLPEFAALADDEPGTFYLTDFLARSFESLVFKGLGLDKRPQLRDAYFGNYKRVLYLSQREDPELMAYAQRAADMLGLEFAHRSTGYGELGTAIASLGARGGGAPEGGRLMATLIVIHWRDIPSQVTAREGRQNAKAMLPMRFQAAIDKAATVAGKKDMDEYLAEWRRVQRPCGADLEAEVAAEVARLEAAYTKERLRALVTGRGLEAAEQPEQPADQPTASPAPAPTEAP